MEPKATSYLDRFDNEPAGTKLPLIRQFMAEEPLAFFRELREKRPILVMPDCFTRYGGSQYVDSPALGRYASYLTEELVRLESHLSALAAALSRRGFLAGSGSALGLVAYIMSVAVKLRDEEDAYAAGEHYLPDDMPATTFYEPTERGLEARIREKLAHTHKEQKGG